MLKNPTKEDRWAPSARLLQQMVPICLTLIFPFLALASTTSGTILTPYAWGENVGWVNFSATGGNIQVTDTALTGYAWDSNYGWINLSPSQSGVRNDGEGNLSGYAWSAIGGYINFSGVVINSSGKFTGMATGNTYGRLNFDCSHCNVTTDWRPVSIRMKATVTNGPIFGSLVSSVSNYFFPQTNSFSSNNQTASVTNTGTTTNPISSEIKPTDFVQLSQNKPSQTNNSTVTNQQSQSYSNQVPSNTTQNLAPAKEPVRESILNSSFWKGTITLVFGGLIFLVLIWLVMFLRKAK